MLVGGFQTAMGNCNIRRPVPKQKDCQPPAEVAKWAGEERGDDRGHRERGWVDEGRGAAPRW